MATSLGASRWQVVFRVILPYLYPAWLIGFGMAFARAIGEYGSVVFIAGNMPMRTEIASLLIITKLTQYDYVGAAAIAFVLLMLSFVAAADAQRAAGMERTAAGVLTMCAPTLRPPPAAGLDRAASRPRRADVGRAALPRRVPRSFRSPSSSSRRCATGWGATSPRSTNPSALRGDLADAAGRGADACRPTLLFGIAAAWADYAGSISAASAC